MNLSDEQRHDLVTHGFVRVAGAVPPMVAREALKAINHSVGKGLDPALMSTYHDQSFCPELRGDRVITGLYNATPLRALVETVIGAGRVAPVSSAQIALRFPSNEDPPPAPFAHIDGMYTPTNGVKKGSVYNFTALAAVLLSDLPGPYHGNFTVWPGTHVRHADYFRQNGPDALLKGMPPIDQGKPLQIIGRAGDVVLAHYLLAHTAAANLSPFIRYAVFFRLTHVDHDRQRWASMTDPWLQWEGLRTAATL